MYQLNFSEQSMRELNKLEKWDQMPIIERFSSLSPKDLENPKDELGKFQRNGKTYYRLRADDYRIYFELQENTLFCHFILNKHTFNDFVFRFKLPVNDELMAEQDQSFWKYVESLGK